MALYAFDPVAYTPVTSEAASAQPDWAASVWSGETPAAGFEVRALLRTPSAALTVTLMVGAPPAHGVAGAFCASCTILTTRFRSSVHRPSALA